MSFVFSNFLDKSIILFCVFINFLFKFIVVFGILKSRELTDKFRVYSFSLNLYSFWIIITHLNVKSLFKTVGHSRTNSDSYLVFLTTRYLSLHGNDFQERLPFDHFNIYFKLKCHFSCVFNEQFLSYSVEGESNELYALEIKCHL